MPAKYLMCCSKNMTEDQCVPTFFPGKLHETMCIAVDINQV